MISRYLLICLFASNELFTKKLNRPGPIFLESLDPKFLFSKMKMPEVYQVNFGRRHFENSKKVGFSIITGRGAS